MTLCRGLDGAEAKWFDRTKSLTTKSALHVLRLEAMSHFLHLWNLYCKAASLLKPYLTYCLAADPGYFPLKKKRTETHKKTKPQDVM